MRRAGERTALLTLVSMLWALSALAAPPMADAQRLREGLPLGFKRPTLVIYPLVDARPITADTPAATSGSVAVFNELVAELARYENLSVSPPAKAISRIKARRAYAEREEFARSKAEEGLADYKSVQLEAAVRHLSEATDLYRELEYVYVDPRSVSRAELALGLARLEKGDAVDANDAFTRALQADARLRLREKFDRAESIAAFERARATLVQGLPAPKGYTSWPADEAASTDVLLLRSRLLPATAGLPERLEVVVLASGGAVLPDTQATGAPEAASRLASRIWSSLPFGRAVREKKSTEQVRLDAGFAWMVYTDNDLGTGLFNNIGAQASFWYSMARHIGLQLAFQVVNSGRDEEEDLRADILTYRGFAGPGFEANAGGWRFDVHLGVEAASPGRIVTTDNVYCKHKPDTPDSIFDALCPPGSVDSTPRTVMVGAGLTAAVSYDVVDELYLALQLNTAEYFYELDQTDLGRPVGASFSLGYRFR